jgi:hypothetical protein
VRRGLKFNGIKVKENERLFATKKKEKVFVMDDGRWMIRKCSHSRTIITMLQ